MRKLIYLFLLIFCASCTEFLSPNIDTLILDINSPIDSLYTTSENITFWWEDDRKAETYRLQVVTPNFANPTLILDSLVADNKHTMTLDEGVYTWRLRAENERAESDYFIRAFIIDHTNPIGSNVLYPMEGDTIVASSDPIQLEWQSLDYPIDGTSFAVHDSVFLYQVFGSTLLPIASYYVDRTDPKILDVTNELGGTAAEYIWQIKTIDQAGNATTSEEYTFWLE